jgi:hypothetical protein
MRLLVLDDAGMVIPDAMVEAIESVGPTSEPGPWLPALVNPGMDVEGPRRALRLRGGGRVEVPAAMHFVDNVEVLELPQLLLQAAARNGVIGLAQLSGSLVLVCDPTMIAEVGIAEVGIAEVGSAEVGGQAG